MAFVQTYRPATGGGSGPTETLRWAFDTLEVTDPFTPGSISFILSHNPVDIDGLIASSAGSLLLPPDYSFTAPNQINIEFSGDPATDAPDGIWIFTFQYQYAV